MGLIILRLIFMFVAAGISVALINSDALPIEYTWLPWATFTGVMAIALAVIVIDILVPRKQIAVVPMKKKGPMGKKGLAAGRK